MKTVVMALVLAWFSGCTFDTAPVLGKKVSTSAMKRSDAGHSGAAGAPDASSIPRDSGLVSSKPAAPAAMDAATAAPDGAMPSGPIATRDDAGLGDADSFGTNPIPTGPSTVPQTGGLQCGGAFCPFGVDPVKPCCTATSDVEHGAARAADHCGLDFSATSSQFLSNLCWQRDQPGVVDSSCPSVTVDAHAAEPGCCSDEGRCGGINTDQALGCHYDPSAAPQTCGGAPGGADAGTHCDLTGVFGIRVVVDLAWGGRSGGLVGLTDDGRGKQVVHLLASFDHIDSGTLALHGSARTCGTSLPTFYSTTLCEAYEPIFPTAMWESSKMPRFPISGRLQCLDPGCIISLDAQTLLLGIELNNPEAPWPTANQTPQLSCPAGTGVKCFPDDDGDGLPGLTVHVTTQGAVTGATTSCSGTYNKRGAPLSSSIAAIFGGIRRSDRVLLGVRMKLGGSATIAAGCNSGSGSGIAEYVNSRAWSCLAQPGTFNFPYAATAAGPNDVCTSSEAAFMDANLPIYSVLAVGNKPDSSLTLLDVSPSQGPQVSIVRLGDPGASVSCSDVRAATYP
jgi:hypothetical protein